ncbi:MAG: aldolase/citrate lyase family protein [Candidatus Latescibacterota bacterium]
MPARPASSRPADRDPNDLGRAFRLRLQGSDVLLGGMVLEYLRPALVKIYARAGFDFIYVEKEHAFLEGPGLADFVLCARDNGLPVISKVGELNRAEVARLLEAGVVGIQLPRTQRREDLLTLVDYVKFPPVGSRAGAPCYGNADYAWPADHRRWLRGANQATLVVAHIETVAGYENVEAIVTTPHVDMVYVGPYDFSISLGHPGEYDHPEVRQAMRRILQVCRRHNVPFGTTASGARAAARWVKAGCRFFEVVDEISLIDAGARRTVQEYRARFQ